MDIRKLTVGQMAQLNNVTKQTLRYYDQVGLLKPYYTEAVTGYRYYHINQSARLDMIQYLKTCGLLLDDIKQQLELSDPEEISAFLRGHLDRIDENIALLEQSKREILRTIRDYQRYELLPKNASVFLEFISERRIYKHTTKIDFMQNEEPSADYELMLRELQESFRDKALPTGYFHNVGTIIRRKFLENRQLHSNEVFVFVDKGDAVEPTEVLPANMYLCLCSDNFMKERDYAYQLTDEVCRRGYGFAGDYICEVVAEFPAFDYTARRMFYKVQIPVLVD